MFEERMQIRENMHVEILAVVEGLATAVFTPRNVKSQLAIIVQFVVRVERAQEYFQFEFETLRAV